MKKFETKSVVYSYLDSYNSTVLSPSHYNSIVNHHKEYVVITGDSPKNIRQRLKENGFYYYSIGIVSEGRNTRAYFVPNTKTSSVDFKNNVNKIFLDMYDSLFVYYTNKESVKVIKEGSMETSSEYVSFENVYNCDVLGIEIPKTDKLRDQFYSSNILTYPVDYVNYKEWPK